MNTTTPPPDRSPTDRSPPYEIIMVVVFIAFGIAVLAFIMSGERHADLHLKTARVAFAPEALTGVDFDEPLIEAIRDGGNVKGSTAFPVPPPPFSDEDIYPCSECHEDLDTNPKRRKLEMAHDQIVLNHGPKERWCFDCHNPDDRDKLRLASGALIGFDESYRLCGQCHGTIYRDWRLGIHGRRRGFWNGKKSYLLCAHCHDPHAPRFKPIKPLPPPVRPQFLEGTEGSSQEPKEGDQR
jgi:hypothetical protein